jgi:protein SCO1/2
MADDNSGNKTLALIRRNAWVLVAAVAALLAISGIVQRLHTGPKVSIGGPFTLTDQNGQRVSDADFRGKLEVIYFGFTRCPDACPTSLALIAQAVKKLPADKAKQVQPIFITLDPERDTPKAMGEYVNYFLPGMEGLTGSTEEIADVARAYRVAYQKTKDPNSDQPYTIDHASMIFVMDRKGKFLRYFPPGVTADQLADVLSKAL